MVFTEIKFLIFFLIVFCLHWITKSNFRRKLILLFSSYIFYSAWDWRFLSLIILSSLVDFYVGRELHATARNSKRHILLIVSLMINLGVLAYFKYANFFIDSFFDLFPNFGSTERQTLNIILPVGISFYTFQTLSYTIDVYRNKLKPVNSLLDFATFVAFFPQLVAGPIVRASSFLPQLETTRTKFSGNYKYLVSLFLLGFFKKAAIADNIAPFVDAVFEQSAIYDSLSHLIATLLYSIQIYCDFSGYSDMAIAIAGCFGYSLCLNFASPYLATSIQDFWRRWHISLSSWLKDYLYIPLGGSGKSILFTSRNLFLTMLLGGLWHGAAMSFVFWGAFHGIALVIQRMWRFYVPKLQSKSETPTGFSVPKVLSWLTTISIVVLLWIPFRTANLTEAILFYQRLFICRSGELSMPIILLFLPVILLILHWYFLKNPIEKIVQKLSTNLICSIWGVIVGLLIALYPLGYRPFIYFAF